LRPGLTNSDLFELYNVVIGKALSKVRAFVRRHAESSEQRGNTRAYNEQYR
jgi:hypothetical protein